MKQFCSPESSGSTMIGSSFSSETKMAHTLELYKELTNISFDRTSNFFWSSPVVLDEPAKPSEQGNKGRPWFQDSRATFKETTNLTESSDSRFPHGTRNELASSLNGIK